MGASGLIPNSHIITYTTSIDLTSNVQIPNPSIPAITITINPKDVWEYHTRIQQIIKVLHS